MNRLSRVLQLVGMVALFAVAPASAQLTNFANFSPDGATPFTFTNNGSGSSFTTSGFIDGTFKYQVPNGYDVQTGNPPSTNIAARMSLTAMISDNATSTSLSNGKTFLDQPVANITLNIVAVNPVNGQSNLLTLTGTGDINGSSGSVNVAFQGDSNGGSTVNFSSDFLQFGNTIQRSFNFALNPVQQPLVLDSNGYLRGFVSGGVANFAADPFPASVLPETNSLVLMALPVVSCAVLLVRRRFRIS